MSEETDVTHVEGVTKAEDHGTGSEPGRKDTGTEYKSERGTGTSDARDMTGVDPQDTQGGATPKG